MIQIIPFDPHSSMVASPIEVIGEAKGVTGIKSVKPVQERTLPPLVIQKHVQSEYASSTNEQLERRHVGRLQAERRTYCRRIIHQPILEGLRSSAERRRRKQRGTDMTEHVDEEV
jgi:hypothetical protein